MTVGKLVSAWIAALAAATVLIPSQALAGPADTSSMVMDLSVGSSEPTGLTAMGKDVYFDAHVGASHALWKAGPVVGFAQVGDAFQTSVTDITKVGDKIFFKAADGFDGARHGSELWVTDGTTQGTHVIDIRNQPNTYTSSGPQYITNVNGTAFFAATGNDGDTELWKSDGTAEGTVQVKNINQTGVSDPQELTAVGNELYFSANDGTHGIELWRSDGSANGTTMVKDLNTDTSAPAYNGNSFPYRITDVGGTAYFSAYTPATGYELFSTDGTTVHTMDVNPGTGDSTPLGIAGANGKAVFFADDGTHGYEPFVSTNGQTFSLLEDIDPDAGNSIDSLDPQFASVGNQVLFAADDSSHGNELWATDGTIAGTGLVKDINATGTNSSNPSNLREVGGYLYFGASGSDGKGVEPWVSDGTGAGTKRFGDINPNGESSYPAEFTEGYHGSVVFSASDGSTGVELWKGTDTVGPKASITSGPAEGSSVEFGQLTFGFGADEHPVTFQCSVDGGDFSDCSTPQSPYYQSLGTHSFSVRAVDAALNTGPAVTRTFTTVDTTPPLLQFVSGGAQGGKQVKIALNCNEICDVAVTGSISIPVIKKKGKVKGKKTYPLAAATKDVAVINTAVPVALAIPGKRAQQALKKAMKAKKSSTVSVEITATDQSGNVGEPETFKFKVSK